MHFLIIRLVWLVGFDYCFFNNFCYRILVLIILLLLLLCFCIPLTNLFFDFSSGLVGWILTDLNRFSFSLNFYSLHWCSQMFSTEIQFPIYTPTLTQTNSFSCGFQQRTNHPKNNGKKLFTFEFYAPTYGETATVLTF